MDLFYLWDVIYQCLYYLIPKGGNTGDPFLKILAHTVGAINAQYVIVRVNLRRAEIRRNLNRKCPDVRLNIHGEFKAYG